MKLIVRGDEDLTFGSLQKVLLAARAGEDHQPQFSNHPEARRSVRDTMKLKGAKAVHYEAGPDMTSLVDVVMVLLIFLMMVGKFGGASRYLESDLPISSAGASNTKVDPNLIPKEPVVITVIQPTPDAFRAVKRRQDQRRRLKKNCPASSPRCSPA